jgi:selenide, water dikinase
MAQLNRDAALVMEAFQVHACTDITGFGLLGHLAEMVLGSGCGVKIKAEWVPVLPGTLDFARMGIVPGGAHRNRDYRQCLVDFTGSIEPALQDIFFDPQTSGGLLIAVDTVDTDPLLAALHERGITEAAIIGEVVAGSIERMIVV